MRRDVTTSPRDNRDAVTGRDVRAHRLADAIGEFAMRSGRSLSRDSVSLAQARGLQRRPTPGRRLPLRPAVMTGAERSGHGGLGAGLIIRLVR
jgi:hypothetical protein